MWQPLSLKCRSVTKWTERPPLLHWWILCCVRPFRRYKTFKKVGRRKENGRNKMHLSQISCCSLGLMNNVYLICSEEGRNGIHINRLVQLSPPRLWCPCKPAVSRDQYQCWSKRKDGLFWDMFLNSLHHSYRGKALHVHPKTCEVLSGWGISFPISHCSGVGKAEDVVNFNKNTSFHVAL